MSPRQLRAPVGVEYAWPLWQQRLVLTVVTVALAACTLHHSKVPIPDHRAISIAPDAKFVTSDDSGLALLGLFVVSEPDHYAVLIERIRRRYNCAEIHHAQLDFYSDVWLFVSFPITRVTAICDPKRSDAGPAGIMPPRSGGTPAPPVPVPPSPPAPEPAPGGAQP
jgi:hypothetical protein